jgi:hypothetical protein
MKIISGHNSYPLIHTQIYIKHYGPTKIRLWKASIEMIVKKDPSKTAWGLDKRSRPIVDI